MLVSDITVIEWLCGDDFTGMHGLSIVSIGFTFCIGIND